MLGFLRRFELKIKSKFRQGALSVIVLIAISATACGSQSKWTGLVFSPDGDSMSELGPFRTPEACRDAVKAHVKANPLPTGGDADAICSSDCEKKPDGTTQCKDTKLISGHHGLKLE